MQASFDLNAKKQNVVLLNLVQFILKHCTGIAYKVAKTSIFGIYNS